MATLQKIVVEIVFFLKSFFLFQVRTRFPRQKEEEGSLAEEGWLSYPDNVLKNLLQGIRGNLVVR